MRHTKLIAGTCNKELSTDIATALSLPLSSISISQGYNKETNVALEESVRGEDVYIMQSGGGVQGANDSLMELLLIINACKLSSARRIHVVMPFFPYSKHCKKKNRSGIAAKLIANMIMAAGADHIITMDLHVSQVQGFFQIPIDNLIGEPSILNYIQRNIPDYKNGLIVAKNPGAMKRVTSLADKLGVEFALVQHAVQQKDEKEAEEKQKGFILVGDARDKVAFILDDLVDSVKTFKAAAQTLMDNGARRVYIVVTHGLISNKGLSTINSADCIHELIITNSVELELGIDSSKIRVVDISKTFAEAIRRAHNGESVSYLFGNVPE